MTNYDLIVEKEIELNFKHNFNVQKFRELSTYPDFKNLFNTRGFCILLWISHDEIIFYKNNFQKIIRYFTSFRLSKSQMFYLLENLQLTFSKSLFPYQEDHGYDHELNLCLDFISIKCDKLALQLNTNIYRQCHLFDFRLIKRNLELIPGLSGQIKYLVKIKAEYNQHVYSPGPSNHSFFNNSFEDDINRHLESFEYEKFRLPSITPDAIISTPSPVKSPEYIAKYVSERICAIDAAQWKYVFTNEKDYKFLINLLAKFFSGQPVDLNFKLDLQPNCKTRLCPVLHSIYAKFDPSPLIKNKDFLSLLKNLSVFEQDSLLKIREDISRSWDVM